MDKSASRFRIMLTRVRENGDVFVVSNEEPISATVLKAGLEDAVAALGAFCKNAKPEGHIPEGTKEPKPIYDIENS